MVESSDIINPHREASLEQTCGKNIPALPWAKLATGSICAEVGGPGVAFFKISLITFEI
jgi:hypothetical protein